MRGSFLLLLVVLLGVALAPMHAQESAGELDYYATDEPQAEQIDYGVMPAAGEQPYFDSQPSIDSKLPEGVLPAEGGHWYDVFSGNCPCDFDSFWDVTGGRSPSEWAGICGYGYECHTWDFRAEYLLWFSRGRNAPVLVERFRAIENDEAVGISPLYGNEPIGENARSGLRLTLDHLLADGQTWIGGRFWGVEDSTERFGAVSSSSRTPRFGQSIFSVQENQNITLVIAAPGQARGTIDVLSKNDLVGGDAWLKRTVWFDNYYRLDLLAGYQFSRMDDSLVVRGSSIGLAGNTIDQPVGVLQESLDSFRTQNEFHGGSIGFIAETRGKIWSAELLGKLGLGSMREAVFIDGRFSDGTTTVPSGILTKPSNIGAYERHRFAVVPELNANGVVNLSPSCRLTIGYSIIYWSHAVLAGNQIDRRINVSPVAGPRVPEFNFVRSDFVVQGLNLGAEYRW